jgi:hexosaminidase
VLDAQTTITYSGENSADVGDLLADYLRPATGFAIPVMESNKPGTIHLHAEGEAQRDDAGFVDESYRLSVKQDGISLSAPNTTGLARAIQTLRQVLPTAILANAKQSCTWTVPLVEIEDAPRFRWRGQHIDVSRHFFSVETICKLIDSFALHRLNIVHLHLTDDQGWRLEIKKYPRLTTVGSQRRCTVIGHQSTRPRRYDSTPHGGHYSQDDIRTIVAYAERRHITIVPEIDMPGHMVAAISAYPELGNLDMQHHVRCHWGISQHVLNLEESTITFMKDVLDEVIALFPGRFIHIGGDEAPKFEWSESRRAQERMAELGLTSEDELQSWFIKQMDDHITQAGRRLIGWDEILEGGLASGAAVMSWRNDNGAIAAANAGHDAVIATKQAFYFDFYQHSPVESEPLAIGGMTTVETVYEHELVPEAIPADKRDHILGGQGQLWTEYIPTAEQLDYMGYPRICALAENLWINPEKKNYPDFLCRLSSHRKRLHTLGINAHPQP